MLVRGSGRMPGTASAIMCSNFLLYMLAPEHRKKGKMLQCGIAFYAWVGGSSDGLALRDSHPSEMFQSYPRCRRYRLLRSADIQHELAKMLFTCCSPNRLRKRVFHRRGPNFHQSASYLIPDLFVSLRLTILPSVGGV
jgi:hypothetical protein